VLPRSRGLCVATCTNVNALPVRGLTRDAGEGREGRNSAHHRLASVEGGNSGFINFAGTPRLTHQAQHSISRVDRQPSPCWRACRLGSNATAATAGAHTLPTRQNAHRETLCLVRVCAIRPHDGKSREGIYARDVATSFTVYLQRACGRAREPGATEALANEKPYPIEMVAKKTVVGTGVGGNSRARPILDLSSLFRVSASKNLGRPALKKFGPSQNYSLRLSGGQQHVGRRVRWFRACDARGLTGGLLASSYE
jgi:hypothetical protein